MWRFAFTFFRVDEQEDSGLERTFSAIAAGSEADAIRALETGSLDGFTFLSASNEPYRYATSAKLAHMFLQCGKNGKKSKHLL